MPLSWEQEQRAPSRAELDREAYEDEQYDTYEDRFREFCRSRHLDPEDTRSVLIYEEEWEELEDDAREERRH